VVLAVPEREQGAQAAARRSDLRGVDRAHRHRGGDLLSLDATEDKAMHHEAVVEHAGAKKLIEEIRGMSAADDYFQAKVTVLSEMIKHHVKEEEQPGGMFAEARKSRMDLHALGEELLARKKQLQAQSKAA
jgi:hypothetical protein